MGPPARMVPRIFVGADDPYPLCPFGASPPDRGSRPHRAAGNVSISLGEFRRLRAASFFLSDQKETKESPGTVAFGKDLRLTPWSFLRHFSPEPRFYGGVR